MTSTLLNERPHEGLHEGLVPPLQSPVCWAEDEQTVLVCTAVSDVTHDVRTFVFEPEGDQLFEFEAGQFLTLLLEIDGTPVNRCYTISSPPTRPHRIAITVKRVPGGQVSNWLHDTVVPGTKLTALAPLGAFTLTHRPAEKLLLLSAGSGVTPLMSMLRTLFDLGSDADVVFLHSARTPSDIVFRSELAAIEMLMPNLRVVHVCEADYPSERWGGMRGRLSPSMLQTVVPDLLERTTFTCGPAPYMDSVRRILGELGYDLAHYREESFRFDDPALPGAMPTPDGVDYDQIAIAPPEPEVGTTFEVEFARSGRTVTCRADESVLDAALAAGVRLASSCSQGMCGTCKVPKLTGEVEMRHNGGIRPREVAAGKILVCCSTPLSDLTLDA
ncbi:hybrid-cluster NAD(P)-dependent oxidoreductase [Nocardioides flavescens]|uniref:2Fe-2S iron-sulfur cluster binding domain-containing protein n=1 Tax=Nocardioides flavescens TaxID=2691959 RepID=A0A6L7EU35_9ACTN|nr:hybrid-cluster NAD(P)-dependent oxidoreductase [Nocardioides flavescens]MXG91017.1 2Fe-2S iron-sulfur cluster binding domain-containing protein [Nocardioides flavescens]